jgi:hypothetical protein
MTETFSPTQGSYRYLCNGEPMPVSESFSMQGTLTGDCRVESLRRAGEIAIAAEAQLSNGRVTSAALQWRHSGEETIAATFTATADRWLVQRQGVAIELPRDEGSHTPQLFPLLRVFTGPMLLELQSTAGRGSVIVPCIDDPLDRNSLLEPRLSDRCVQLLESDDSLSLAGLQWPCSRYAYTGGRYGEETRCWVSRGGLLLRYCWQQSPEQLWDVQLQLAQ